MPGSAAIKVLLYDNHTLFRESLRQALETDDGISVVGETSDPETASALCADLKPDIVLLDALASGELVERVRRLAADGVRVLVLTWHDDPWMVRTLLTQGILGYLLKGITRRELIAAINFVVGWEQRLVLVMAASDTLVNAMHVGRPGAPGTDGISQRERDILSLVAQGLSNAQIGKRLSITEGTVKRHLSNVYGKLGAVSRVDAVNKAVTATIIPSVARARYEDGEPAGTNNSTGNID